MRRYASVRTCAACVSIACLLVCVSAVTEHVSIDHRVGFFEARANSLLNRRNLVAKNIDAAIEPNGWLKKVQNFQNSVANASTRFLRAAVAGGFAATLMFPVDMAKTRMQDSAQLASVVGHAPQYTGTMQTIKGVLAKEGPGSLFQGLKPVLIGSAPEMAIQITSYELMRDHLTRNEGMDPNAVSTNAIAGAVAGFCHTLASNPMEVLKVRGQVLGHTAGSMRVAMQEVGMKGMFQGISASWAMHIPFSVIYFPAYAAVKNNLESRGHPELLSSLGAGLIAGVAAAAPTTPCDVVKTRLQTPNRQFPDLLRTVQHMYRQEGLGSFFVGLKPRVGRSAPYLAISLTSYEGLRLLHAHLDKTRPLDRLLDRFSSAQPRAAA